MATVPHMVRHNDGSSLFLLARVSLNGLFSSPPSVSLSPSPLARVGQRRGRTSSEDRKPVGAGSPPPAAAAAVAAAHKIQLKSADMKEEMQQEAFEIAHVVNALALALPSLFLRSIWGFRCSALFDGLFVRIWGFIYIFFYRFVPCRSGVQEAQHGEGHRGVHKEGVRQEPRPNLALHRRPQLR